MMRLSFALMVALSLIVVSTDLYGQGRDLRAERLVLDDNRTDSTLNTITIQTPSTLSHDLILTIPDPGIGATEFRLTSSGSGGYWSRAGNSGTVPGTSFLGTTDSTALQIQIRGASGTIANSLILNQNRSLQRDTAGDARGLNAVDLQIVRSAATEVAASNHSIITGGEGNEITATAGTHTTIRGGSGNIIRENQSRSATIGGGWNGLIEKGQHTVVGGGNGNVVDSSGPYSVIGGGRSNFLNLAFASSIGGGGANRSTFFSVYSPIGGGEENELYNSSECVVIGGESNEMSQTSDGAIGGGGINLIQFNARRATIGAGIGNILDVGVSFATIRGGAFNWIRRRAIFPNDSWAVIGGGAGHTLGQGSGTSISNALYAVIAGGRGNIIRVDGAYSTISGGTFHEVADSSSVIPGGRSLDLNGNRSFGFLANGGSNNMAVSEPDVALFANVNVWLANNNNRPSQLRLYEPYDTTGTFPGSAHYTSFEAPPLTDTIQYILPATKPSATGQVLAVSAINGDTITLAWGADNTVAARDGGDVPTTIAVPDNNSRLEIQIRELEAEYEAQERQFELQQKELKALQTKVHLLKRQESDL
ncbi:MAG: hypothetical protein AB7H80_00495 [Candidatus Kapaibacterium sp.]